MVEVIYIALLAMSCLMAGVCAGFLWRDMFWEGRRADKGNDRTEEAREMLREEEMKHLRQWDRLLKYDGGRNGGAAVGGFGVTDTGEEAADGREE